MMGRPTMCNVKRLQSLCSKTNFYNDCKHWVLFKHIPKRFLG